MTLSLSPPIRLAVIGAGSMGSQHMRLYDQLEEVRLEAVVDIDPARAIRAATSFNCRAFSSVEELRGNVDAVSITTAARAHASIGTYLLRQGIHCLIEKPLATTEADCVRLIEAANESGAVLLVGHIERFNPVFSRLEALLASQPPITSIVCQRLNPDSARVLEIDVAADLMVHDLDIVLSLVKAPLCQVLVPERDEHFEINGDHVSALLSFENGVVATLTASRLAREKLRRLEVTTGDEHFIANYHTQELQARRLPGLATEPETETQLESELSRLIVQRQEPLALELRHFVDCLTHGARPRVCGEDALRVMRVVWKIQAQLATSGKSEQPAQEDWQRHGLESSRTSQNIGTTL